MVEKSEQSPKQKTYSFWKLAAAPLFMGLVAKNIYLGIALRKGKLLRPEQIEATEKTFYERWKNDPESLFDPLGDHGLYSTLVGFGSAWASFEFFKPKAAPSTKISDITIDDNRSLTQIER